MVLVHLYSSPEQNEEAAIRKALDVMQGIFPELNIEFVSRQGRFGFEAIDSLSHDYGVEKNNIFIGAPEQKHAFSIQSLGGVRVIF